ncbi:MAG: cation-transporting P-type ATPase [Clostridia bacterium]|nr:cation-transporting P-type ATPase [Clostridia bacterium]
MKYKDYAGSKEDVVRNLNSNAAFGLTHKAARVRFGRTSLSDEREFYYAPRKTWSQLIAPSISDFSFWLMLLTSGALAFFDHTRLSVLCLIFILLNFVFSVTVSRISAFFESSLIRGFRPKVKVIREGKLFVTDCRYIVRGDVVLLSKGDVVPFDARLLTAEKLTVSVYCGRDKAEKDRYVTRERDAETRLDGRRDIPPEGRVNMVTAGSVILSGSARAIVTETGSYTYIGALSGGISLGKTEEKNSLVPTVLRWTKNIGVILLLLFIPLTAMAYLLGEPRDLAVSFLTVLSFSTAVFPGWIIALLDLSATRAIYRFVRQKKDSAGGFLRSASVSERLASMDVLILAGRSMLTDGRPYVIGVFADGVLFSGGELKSPSCRSLAEKAVLFARRASEAPTRHLISDDALADLRRKELLEYAAYVEVDAEMLDIRYRVSDYRTPTRENPLEALQYFDTAEESGSARVLCSVIGESLLLHCTHIAENGEITVLTPEKRAAVLAAMRSCSARGGSNCCYAEKGTDGALIFLGFIAYAEVITQETRRAVSALSAVGVRVILFLEGEGEADRYYARASGVVASDGEIATISRFRREGKRITEGFGAFSAYLGFSQEEKCDLISELEENGIRTGIVILDNSDSPLSEHVSVRIACGEPASIAGRDDVRELTELPISGVRYGAEASEATRMEADALIPRASRSGGGLSAIRRAILLGRRIERRRKAFLNFLLLFFGLSAGWLLPILVGLGDLYAAVSLSFVGLVACALFGLVILLYSKADDDAIEARLDLRKRRDIIRGGVCRTVTGAIAGLLLSAAPLLLRFFGGGISAHLLGAYRGIALLLATVLGFFYVCFHDLRHSTDIKARKK